MNGSMVKDVMVHIKMKWKKRGGMGTIYKTSYKCSFNDAAITDSKPIA
jgi:hypothetical protein